MERGGTGWDGERVGLIHAVDRRDIGSTRIIDGEPVEVW